MARGGGIGNGNFVRGTGQRSSNTRGNWRGRGSFKSFRGGRGGNSRGGHSNGDKRATLTTQDGTADEARIEDEAARHALDEKFGFLRFQEGPARIGWLVNMKATLLRDEQYPAGRAAVDFYFIEEDGGLFKSTLLYEPYFYLVCKKGYESQVEEYLLKRFEGTILRLERQRKEDLKLPNHLLGYRRTVIQLVFRNANDLFLVRKELLPVVQRNQAKMDAVDAYAEVVSRDHDAAAGMMDTDFADDDGAGGGDALPDYVAQASNAASTSMSAATEHLIDIREYDVPYCLRVAIDQDIRVGLWYTVKSDNGEMSLSCLTERVERNDPVVFTFDIETTKAPLKFPDSAHDQIMMISYMIDGQGYLITNREIVSEDIEDFEYTPKPEYEGPFVIFNEPDEKALLERFFEHFRESRATIMVTYNGDFFDFPFVEARAQFHKLDLLQETGFAKNNEGDYFSRSCAHMDAFRWVKRDSYLPQGSQGLKAVTTAKLGYNPDELDPELMTPYAVEQPHVLAQYSVSDAVATYYLYMKYVHPFIFSLCNIIPLTPDEVLRKGSGTLCETLLMVEAFKGQVLMPNRHTEAHGTMFEGHLLESETYVGGHVEALEAGIFRSDIETDFKIVPSAPQKLIDELDRALKFAIVEENKLDLAQVLNYDEVKNQIQAQLEDLRDNPIRQDKPLIYHLDVAAMYPNIMLSNRLQPDSVVTEAMCAACDYNRPGKTCDRRMTWAWRGEFFPAKMDEYKMVRNALESERFPPKWPSGPERRFIDLSPAEQTTLLHKRLGDYSRKVYAKTHETRIIEKESIICQRENPFYIDTVRAFRDRRYTYKGLHKDWKKKLDKAGSLTETTEAKKMIVLYDSLQLAHKCILNSFYGYVMRKGARWHSMEMAGITCLTGATIIQLARQLVEQIGRPLELDTDGIWCMLPGTFPDNFSFKLAGGKKLDISYPCTMLNHLVHDKFTNHQYHDLVDPERGTYEVHSENSIFFELDGPYRAMVLPASKEEDKLLKKRYAVFEEDGSLAELKGFEVKRRGELQLIKIFQTAIFERFLDGSTLKECYAAVATIADKWLDVLTTKGVTLPDEELVELIAENRSMSKTLAEYAGQKSTSISTAKRLAEFLGEQMVKDKGLACKFIISHKPHGAPVTERAVPVAIFDAEDSIKQHFLRKWLKDNGLTSFDLRDILDWDYYIERLGSVIQKLITIPAALQRIPNPVPRVHHPDWLARRVANLTDKFKQHNLSDMFAQQRVSHQKQIESGDPLVQKLQATRVEPTQKPTKSKATASTALSDVLPEGPAPDIKVDYPAWVAHMKPFWRKHRKEKKALQSSGMAMSNGAGGRLGSMLQKQTFSLDSHIWDIVQIAEVAGRPGEFKLWLLIDGTLQAVRLHVPRQFLINFKTLPEDQDWPEDCQVEAISRTLPRSHRALNLLRVTTSESNFLQQASDYAVMMNRPEVDAIYEMQVPLLVRALLTLGTTCMASPGVSLRQGLDKGFIPDQLLRPQITLSKHRYLSTGSGLNYIYLYHGNSDSRHFIALLFPNGRTRLLVVERGNNREMPNVEKYYKEQLANVLARGTGADSLKNSKGVFDYPEDLRVETSFHPTSDPAFRAVSRELVSYSNQKAGPSVLVVYSAFERNFFEDKVPATAQFPMLMIATRSTDNSFAALGWRQPACRRMVQHYLRVSGHLRHQIARADAFDVPLCNLERDDVLFCADIDFARRLNRSDMALWWSESPRPDLGGRENDNNTSPEDLSVPTLSRPGCYTNACLEVELSDLVVDAVMQSALVYELEGAEGASVGFSEASHNLDDYRKGQAQADVNLGDSVLPQQTFALIKSMVKSWWAEAGKADGASARRVLDHFWRWVSSPSAKLFDPAVHRFVHGLMRKTFSQLVAEFRRLGAEVVYADFTRLFLLTGKPTANMAYAYSNYIVTSINSRELFKYVSLSIMQYWDLLLWMDVANFGGVTCSNPLAEDEKSIAQSSEIDMNWNIATFLPEAVRPQFREIVASFVHGLQSSKAQSMANFRSPLRVLQNTITTQPDPKKNEQSTVLRDFVGHTMTRRLLKEVQDLQKRHAADAPDPEARALWDFPQLPGSHLPLKNPILELVKFVCAILALSKESSTEVGVLRRNLLDMIGVREFSAQAVFRNPAIPFRIDMVCQYCTSVRTFDLTRDSDLLQPVPPGSTRQYPCFRCNHSHDPLAIEAAILDQLMTQVTTYQLSDLKCTRCQEIKSNNLALYCSCSGAFQTADSRTELLKKLRTIASVADFYNFGALAEAVSFVGAHL